MAPDRGVDAGALGCTTIKALRQFANFAREPSKESVAGPEAASRRSVDGRQLLPQRQVF
jgi:hypothetical protein